MAKFWYRRIKKGLATIEDVPEYWRAEVQEMLDNDEQSRD